MKDHDTASGSASQNGHIPRGKEAFALRSIFAGARVALILSRRGRCSTQTNSGCTGNPKATSIEFGCHKMQCIPDPVYGHAQSSLWSARWGLAGDTGSRMGRSRRQWPSAAAAPEAWWRISSQVCRPASAQQDARNLFDSSFKLSLSRRDYNMSKTGFNGNCLSLHSAAINHIGTNPDFSQRVLFLPGVRR